MKSQIVEYLRLKAATIGGVNTHLGIHELRTNGSGQTVPYAYVGGDDLQPLDIDNGSVGYFRTYQREEFTPVEGMRAERDLSGTFYIRYAAILHRDTRDHVAYAEDVANAFTGFNSDLKSILKAKRVNVTRSSIETDITRAWREEFSVPVTDLPYNLAMVFVDVTVTVVGSRDCWQGCGEQYDILRGFDWCNPATVARLTEAQRDCIRGFLPTPCEDADYTLEDTDGNTLSTGSIPSGGSSDIVAPDGNIELNGTPVGVVASGGNTDIPVIQDGSPVGSWNGTQWVIPSCPAGGVSLAVTVSDNTPDNGDTVTITATPSTGFVPTEYTYLLFDGVNITLLAEQSGNTFNWTVTQPSGLYDIYVLATDGTDYAWNEQQVDVQATYLLGVYPQDVAAMFATFRLLGTFNTRLMEIRRTVGATTTVIEIGLDGDYTTLDSPVLAVVTGSSSATTLGEFVAASGYTDVDSLGSPQSAFAVRGYYQLDGSQAWEQLVATHQPRLVNSGVLEVLDGKGCLAFSGNQWQDYGLITGANKPANYTTLTVCSVDTTSAQGVFGSRPTGSGQTPFSYGHLWANQPGARSTYLFGNGAAGSAQYTTVVNTIVTSSIQYHEDYKSSGVDGSQVFSDGVGPLLLTYGANTTNDVAGSATRMLYGRLGDLAGTVMSGRQLFFGVYAADKIADRLGIKLIINGITGQSW